MELELSINGVVESVQVPANESLLTLLRQRGYFSVKQGCETGDCGACTVLVDGMPRASCVMLAAQAGGCILNTVESLGSAHKLHPLQEAFVEVGAVQCGFCMPGMLLSAHALLKENPQPTEDEVRDALSGHLCRCTGYVKPVQAVLRAAARMRGETQASMGYQAGERNEGRTPDSTRKLRAVSASSVTVATGKLRAITATASTAILSGTEARLRVIGKPVRDVEAVKLVTGKSAFADDILLQGMLYGRILTSPHAHALIRNIDISAAKVLPGVHAILTYKDVSHLSYSSVERVPTESGPYDMYCLDNIVRYVGDRVALVAAETPEIAEQATRLIEVDYEVLPAVFDPRQALVSGAPILHPESESPGIVDAQRNVAAHILKETGDVERGFAQADLIVEEEYTVAQAQQTPLENHSAITYFDEDDCLVVRSSTQAPHHIRRTLSAITGLPARRIRVVKPNIGGDFGVKQELLLEDVCALLTIATGRPVRLTYTRAEEFSSRSSHTCVMRCKTGVMRDGAIAASQVMLIASTGAHGTHPLTGQSSGYVPALSLYPSPNMRFIAEVLYTNLPPSGAFRGYAVPQEFFALECHMDEIASRLGMDALELRRKNWLRAGDRPALTSRSNGAKGEARLIESCGLAQCLQVVEEKLRWREKRWEGKHDQQHEGDDRGSHLRRGIGVALSFDGGTTASMSGAIIKLNEDGSVDVFATDCGTGSRTLLAQVAAEILAVSPEDILLHTSETSQTLSETNAQATLYSSVGAVRRAAELLRRQMLAVAGRMLNILPEVLKLNAGGIIAPDGQRVILAQVAAHALYVENRHIVASASWKSQESPVAFAAQGVEVEVNIETGNVRVLKAITAVDGGRFINPSLAEAQIQGSATQALGAGICEELIYDQAGTLLTKQLSDYRIYNAPDMPEMQTYLVETDDASVPFGAKAVTAVPLSGMAPAIANAVADATGVRIRQVPLTPERVLRAIHAHRRQI